MEINPIESRKKYQEWLRKGGDQIEFEECSVVSNTIDCLVFNYDNSLLLIWYPIHIIFPTLSKEDYGGYEVYKYNSKEISIRNSTFLKRFGHTEKDLELAKEFCNQYYRSVKFQEFTGENYGKISMERN